MPDDTKLGFRVEAALRGENDTPRGVRMDNIKQRGRWASWLEEVARRGKRDPRRG
jgi:hypothetical protein